MHELDNDNGNNGGVWSLTRLASIVFSSSVWFVSSWLAFFWSVEEQVLVSLQLYRQLQA